MNNGVRRAVKRLVGAPYEIFATLREHLNRDVIGNEIIFNNVANKIKIGLRGRGEADFNFFKSHRH